MFRSLFSPRTDRAPARPEADPFGRFVIVSFYTPGGYYEEKAAALRAQCDHFGLEHDIAEISRDPSENWADICRRKVRHYRDMLHKHECAIMWLDVDSVLIRDIGHLHQGHFDIALFMRNFKFLPQYDPNALARTFHPGYLLFRHTPRTIRFLDDCQEIDRTHDGDFTDDYILEEAFRTSSAQPRLMLLSPDDIARPIDADKPDALFRHGNSGHVNEYKDRVRQHQPRNLEPDSQRRVFAHAISDAARRGKRRDVIALMEASLRADPADHETYIRLLPTMEALGLHQKLLRQIEGGLADPARAPYALRFQLLQALRRSDWDAAEALFERIKDTGHRRMIAFSRSRMFRHDLDRRAQAAGVPDADRTPLYWWEEPYPGNLGDIINPYIVEKLTGVPPRHAPAGEGICAIGSIIRFARKDTPVWGSGSPHSKGELDPLADYRAVRGPLTRDLVLRNGGTCPEVYGDPAWCLPILYRPERAQTHRTGLILHYTHADAELDIGEEIRRIGILRLGYDEIEAFLDEMRACERIVSTSLHGVIIAQAYGVPAALATVSGAARQVHGDGIKFRDYFLSVGIDAPAPAFDLSETGLHDDRVPETHFRLASRPIALEPLLRAAPFTVLPQMLDRARAFDQS